MLGSVGEYRTAMARFAAMKNLEVWYAHVDVEQTMAQFGPQLAHKNVKRTEKALSRARTHDSLSAFSKLTREIDGRPRIVSDPPLIVPLDDLAQGGNPSKCSRRWASACAPTG